MNAFHFCTIRSKPSIDRLGTAMVYETVYRVDL
jgi:hypothetical protein